MILKRLRNLVSPPACEQRAALLAGINISYTLKRSSRRRSIGLRIDDCGLTVSAPLRASEKWLHSVLQDKAGWVLEKLDGWQMRKPLETRWADGEKICYLGDQLTLRVAQGRPALWQHGHDLLVHISDANDAKAIECAVTTWLRREALKLFHARVIHYAALLKVAPSTVKLSAAKKRWGSCTVRGAVRLNVQLIKLPLALIDYVVVHELAHLREMNHSAAFWLVVGSVCPDYAKLRRELKAIAL